MGGQPSAASSSRSVRHGWLCDHEEAKRRVIEMFRKRRKVTGDSANVNDRGEHGELADCRLFVSNARRLTSNSLVAIERHPYQDEACQFNIGSIYGSSALRMSSDEAIIMRFTDEGSQWCVSSSSMS